MRLLADQERGRFDLLLKERHHLVCSILVGELGVPSDSTFRRVLMNLDPGAFAAIVGQWRREQEILRHATSGP